MTATITFNDIKQIFNEAVAHVEKTVEKVYWSKQITGKVLLTDRKRAYGLAHSNGDISINRKYIGTQEWNHLKSTIIHEIAHMVVGFAQGHNNTFKRMNSILCVDFCQEECKYQQHNNEVNKSLAPKMVLAAQTI